MTAAEKTIDARQSDEVKRSDIPLQEIQLGVWTVFSLPLSSMTSTLPGMKMMSQLLEGWQNLPIVWRFFSDTIRLGPWLFAFYLGSAALSSIFSILQLYNETALLRMVQNAVTSNKPVTYEQFKLASIIYISTVFLGWLARRSRIRISAVLEDRLLHHFNTRILASHCILDLATAESPDTKTKLSGAAQSATDAWTTLDRLIDTTYIGIKAIGQILVLVQAFGANVDVQLLWTICILRPWVSTAWWSQFTSLEYYTMVTNNSWLTMMTLFELGTNLDYKKEVLGNSLDKYIISEYNKHRNELGDIWVSRPSNQMMKLETFSYKDIDSFFDSLPLLVYAYRSMKEAGNVDLSNLMLMQQASNTIESLIYRVTDNSRALSGAMQDVNSLYEVIDAKPAMIDGDLAYPEEHFVERKGMSLEFRSVCFSYPQKSEPVLQNLTFTIHPGQLCVIVGENGCGKSTTVQLFTRLYDATSGDILVDGRPLREFRIDGIRSATSIMYQDYTHLPLTVHENILLGRPDAAEPHEEVQQATRLGGSYDVIQKLPLKFDTNLKPRTTGYSRAGWKSSSNKAFDRFVEAQKPTKLSGGEWQRLAISKSFMKNTDQVRLLCYDEPSASLDPKAEQETFERLRKLRGEKTMIFVTHRFGHLTKHADLILYMKGGSIVEQGTHGELLEQAGEYAKMYNIQAQAFLENTT
ncbi:hypothetical protein FRC12_012459 [Ceratobasidium sp. 428]|nr:hypothetical protein FRC12_012459 [Ceratobasidium sp. 428]